MKSEKNELEMTKNKSRKTELRWDERTGRYCAKLGRKRMPSGNFDGHLFRFTPNERESEQRKNQIQILWDQIVDEEGSDCLWTEHSLKVAKALAEGKAIVKFSADELAPKDLLRSFPLDSPQRCRATFFATAICGLQRRYSMVNVAPIGADQDLFDQGESNSPLKLSEFC